MQIQPFKATSIETHLYAPEHIFFELYYFYSGLNMIFFKGKIAFLVPKVKPILSVDPKSFFSNYYNPKSFCLHFK